MNLEEIKEFLSFEGRLDILRSTYRATVSATTAQARAEQRSTLQEALELIASLADRLNMKLTRMEGFRSKLTDDAERCRGLLAELDDAPVPPS